MNLSLVLCLKKSAYTETGLYGKVEDSEEMR
jgi:hypothetical protein